SPSKSPSRRPAVVSLRSLGVSRPRLLLAMLAALRATRSQRRRGLSSWIGRCSRMRRGTAGGRRLPLAPSGPKPRSDAMRKIVLVVVVLAIILTVWVGGNAYLARRLVIEPAWPAPLERFLLVAITCLAVLPFLQPLGERLIGTRRGAWLAWP